MAAPEQTLSQQAIAVFESSPALVSAAGVGALVVLMVGLMIGVRKYQLADRVARWARVQPVATVSTALVGVLLMVGSVEYPLGPTLFGLWAFASFHVGKGLKIVSSFRRENPVLATVTCLAALVALAANGKVVTYEWVDVDDDDIVIPLIVSETAVADLEWSDRVDDAHLIVQLSESRALGPLMTPALGHPSPATLMQYRAVHQVWGMDPTPQHVLGLVHMIAATAALSLFLGVLFRDRREEWYYGPIVFVGAAFFAVHPLTALPTALVFGLKDIGPVCFLLGALTALVIGEETVSHKQRMLLFFGCFLVALSYKGIAVGLVPVLLYWMLSGHGLMTPAIMRKAATASLHAVRTRARRTSIAGTATLSGQERAQLQSSCVLVAMTALGLVSVRLTRFFQTHVFENWHHDVPFFERVGVMVGYAFYENVSRFLSVTADLPMFVSIWQRAWFQITPVELVRNQLLLALAVAGTVVCLCSFPSPHPRSWRLRPHTPFRWGLVIAWAFYLPVSNLGGNVNVVVTDRFITASLIGAITMCVAALEMLVRQAPSLRISESNPSINARAVPALVLAAALGLLVPTWAHHAARLEFFRSATSVLERGMLDAAARVPEEINSVYDRELWDAAQYLCTRRAALETFPYEGPTGTDPQTVEDFVAMRQQLRRCDPTYERTIPYYRQAGEAIQRLAR